ncbi:MAG: IS1634 family transposase [Firmicutes bacterium]|nr:IS1634 family transposase [Bacillota bacterium]
MVPLATIVARRRGRKLVYYYHETYRVKIAAADRSSGDKRRGSGPSRVVTREIYLGTAERLAELARSGGGRPKRVASRAFGLVMAAHSIVEELAIPQAVDALVPRPPGSLSVGTYVALMVVAKACAPRVSWRSFGAWLEKTTLARHLALPRSLLDAQNFWDAFDRLMPERRARERAQHDPDALWRDETILAIEEAVWRRLLERYPHDLSTILIDATNFFTYLSKDNPARLPQPGHDKAGRHEKRQVSLSLAVTSPRAMPLVHLTYAGNVADVRLFPHVLRRLLDRVRHLDPTAAKLTLVFDRGHNSKANLAEVASAGAFAVGSLIPSQHPDLMALDVKTSAQRVGDLRVLQVDKTVYGQRAVVVITYNEKLERKQRIAFDAALRALRSTLVATCKAWRDADDATFQAKMDAVLDKSRVGRYMTWQVDSARGVHIRLDRARVQRRRRQFGRRLLFSTRTDLTATDIVRLYNRDKAQVEADFRQIKSPDLVRFAPIRHFTDTKIRLYALVCVLALLVLKVLVAKTQDLGLSLEALTRELAGIEEVLLVYGPTRVEHTLTECTPIQEALVERLGLQRYLPS